MKYLERRTIPTHVTGSSLIGVGRQRPCSWGNYCWVGGKNENIRIFNMWAENITTANKRFRLHGGMEALVYNNECAIVIDERIPKDWRYDKLCFTGYGKPPVHVAQEMYEYLGDPDNEFEQFTNPVAYHARRGAIWSDRGYIIQYMGPKAEAIKKHFAETGEILSKEAINAVDDSEYCNPRKLKGKWTVKQSQDLTALIHPDAEELLTQIFREELAKELKNE
jgi:hypothetical protein